MKLFSLVLRVIAVLGAAFCVYVWLDTKDIISEATGHMEKLSGETLVAKASNVPALISERNKFKNELDTANENIKKLEAKLAVANNDLDTERKKISQVNADLVKRNADVRTLTADMEKLKKTISTKESEIETLKAEIVRMKSSSDPILNELKTKVAELEAQIASAEAEKQVAIKAAVDAAMANVSEVVEIDADGNKVVRKVVKAAPYVATGDVASVLKADFNNKVFVINRGTDNSIVAGQKILFKREGKFVTEALVAEALPNMSVMTITNRDEGTPETIEINDQLELFEARVVEAPVAKAQAQVVAPTIENSDDEEAEEAEEDASDEE